MGIDYHYSSFLQCFYFFSGFSSGSCPCSSNFFCFCLIIYAFLNHKKSYDSLFLKKSDLPSLLLSAFLSAFLFLARSRSISLWLPLVIINVKIMNAMFNQIIKIMDKIVNLINLTGWVFLLIDLQIQFVFSLKDFLVSDITFLVYILRSVQLFQIFDMVLILLKKSKGNLLASFFQILGRLAVCCVFVQPQTHPLKFAGLVVCWSIADINRYLYYLYKDSPITSFLRYNSFLVLYPLGVICEMLVINDFIQRHPDLTQEYVIVIRVIQVLIVGGMLFLYNYMLGGRKKWTQQKLQNEKKKDKNQSTKSE